MVPIYPVPISPLRTVLSRVPRAWQLNEPYLDMYLIPQNHHEQCVEMVVDSPTATTTTVMEKVLDSRAANDMASKDTTSV